jgi:hypothetical protein
VIRVRRFATRRRGARHNCTGSRWHSDCGLGIEDCGRPLSINNQIRNPQSAIRIEEGGTTMEPAPEETTTAPAVHDRQLQVQVLSTSMTIHDLSIERPSIVEYLRTIAPDKQAIALIHAIEVGVTEMLARRSRMQR